MAVYTPITEHQAREFLIAIGLGKLQFMEPCQGGIENTNYFVDTDQGHYVLTLFERLTDSQLPYYLELMRHLARKGIAVPTPQADAHGKILFHLCNKPAAVVQKLRGRNDGLVTPGRCAQVGSMLAKMHLAAADFSYTQPTLRGLAWWNETIPTVAPYLQPHQQSLIQNELRYQNHVATSEAYQSLPKGPVHADLFRDNVMFDAQEGEDVLTGFFDFYFAGNDTWLFDLSVCLNDWCVSHSKTDSKLDAVPDSALQAAFLDAYERIRPLTDTERTLQSALLRAAALRFWVSRLWDWYLPRKASLLTPHDPSHFEHVLLHRIDEV